MLELELAWQAQGWGLQGLAWASAQQDRESGLLGLVSVSRGLAWVLA